MRYSNKLQKSVTYNITSYICQYVTNSGTSYICVQTVTVVTSHFLRFDTFFDLTYLIVASVTLPQFQSWPMAVGHFLADPEIA